MDCVSALSHADKGTDCYYWTGACYLCRSCDGVFHLSCCLRSRAVRDNVWCTDKLHCSSQPHAGLQEYQTVTGDELFKFMYCETIYDHCAIYKLCDTCHKCSIVNRVWKWKILPSQLFCTGSVMIAMHIILFPLDNTHIYIILSVSV